MNESKFSFLVSHSLFIFIEKNLGESFFIILRANQFSENILHRFTIESEKQKKRKKNVNCDISQQLILRLDLKKHSSFSYKGVDKITK